MWTYRPPRKTQYLEKKKKDCRRNTLPMKWSVSKVQRYKLRQAVIPVFQIYVEQAINRASVHQCTL